MNAMGYRGLLYNDHKREVPLTSKQTSINTDMHTQIHVWCIIIMSSLSGNKAESTQWHKVSGEQVFMPLREIGEHEMQAEKDHLLPIFSLMQLSSINLQFFPPPTFIFDPCSFTSFFSFMALLLPTQLSHHPLSWSVFLSRFILLLACHCCASLCL